MAFIRPFEPKDAEDCKHICRATLPPSLQASPEAVTISPYLWTLQFTHLSPQTCFVLDDGTGKVVGYVIGTPDVFKFAADYPRYVKDVLQSPQGLQDVPVPKQLDTLEGWTKPDGGGVNVACLAQTAYKVEWLVLDGVEGKRELVEGYRAMMHIDLLEPWQGKGWGRKMIELFVRSVKEEAEKEEGVDKGKGIQIGVAGENTKVVQFYEKVGFRVYPGGEREGNVWMVMDL
ncbi:acyl-CoA N-acyltransferase [Cladorrhinum sp. PSN332]|nr:acyl-CoA N-acyltransferase [Cladorrhinum sp. PSN332]